MSKYTDGIQLSPVRKKSHFNTSLAFCVSEKQSVKQLSSALPQIRVLSQSSPQALTKVTPDLVKAELALITESFSITT